MKGSGLKWKDQAENERIRLKMKGSGWKRKDQAENVNFYENTTKAGSRIAIGNYKQRVKDTENNNAFKMFLKRKLCRQSVFLRDVGWGYLISRMYRGKKA